MSSTSLPPVDPEEQEEVFADLNSILLTTSLLMIVMIGYRINTNRLKNVPESGVAMLLGFVLCLLVRALGIVEEERVMNLPGTFFFYVLLPPIIFEAGLGLETQMFVDNFGAILAFAVIGTLVSTWITSTSLYMMAGTGLIGLSANAPRLAIHCHMFGALISATDPVATIALFGGARFRADPLLSALINGESVLNDAVAIALFSTLTMHLNEESPRLFSFAVMGHFFAIGIFSLILGLVAGAFLSWCFCRARFLSQFPNTEIGTMCLGAYLTFAVAQLLGLSGIVSLFFFGAVLSQYNWYNLSDQSKVASHVTFGTLAKLAESCVFLYLGVVAALSIGRFRWHFGLVVYTGIVITVARAAHIFPLSYLCNMWRRREGKIGKNVSVVMWISGLRGAIAFALSLRLPCTTGFEVKRGQPDCQNTDLLVTTTISIVMVTTLIVGTAMEKLMFFFGVIELAESDSMSVARSASDIMSMSNTTALSVPLASKEPPSPSPSVGSTRASAGEVSSISSGALPADEGAGATGMRSGGGARSLWALRFNARGELYQAFARFDLNILQPVLGGPCRGRHEYVREEQSMELPTFQVPMAGVPPAEEAECALVDEDPPAWSRAAIFE